jgi:eukaryotic-like serine/threonine-protein kinase
MKFIHWKQVLACGFALALPAVAIAQSPIWTFKTSGPIYASPTVHADVVYVGSSDGHLYALDAASGTERWRASLGGAVDAAPAVAGGMVFVGSRDGNFHALDAAEGTLLWSFRTGGEKRLDFWDFYLSDPLVHGQRVIFGSGDGSVYALDLDTGERHWSFMTDGAVHAAPVADDRTVYVASFDGGLYALDLESGAVSWTFQTEGNEFFPRGELQRAPLLHDGVLYAGSRDYHLYAIDAASGDLLWQKREGDGWIIATPLAIGDLLYFGASDGQRFYAIDRATGEERWSIPVHTRVFGSAIEVADVIVFGGFNGKILGVDPDSGDVRWVFQTPASRANYGTVYDDRGALTEAFRDLYRTGRWREAEERILTLGSIPGTPAVRGSTIYFGSTEGVVYALELHH